ncbi:MAG: type II toxin-antitoxin system prevent-host-death family antitoxin [Thermoanaerobaculia bacterium]|nr:type II toxin-antitoxin system prevent-host-death family antitoxin [Thermoanaerobaculia bacterium]
MRDLRNRGGEVVERVLAGETLTVTRAGSPVATLLPLRKRPLDRITLLERWRRLPPIDVKAFRNDIDTLLDSTL